MIHFLKIFSGVRRAEVSLCRFADNHALLTLIISKILKRKFLVIVGGYEVARIKNLRYGLNRSMFFPKVVKWIFRFADHVLPVSHNLKEDAIEQIKTEGNNITVIPNGFDSDLFRPSGKDKEQIVLSSGICNDMPTFFLKGIDTLLKTAEHIPKIHFFIIGISEKLQKKIETLRPQNVTVIASLPQEKLISYYQRAKVYCQLSLREGHPNSLCEAMLCECVPVGSDVPGMKNVMNKIGFLVPLQNPSATAKAIEKALQSTEGLKAREKIKQDYSLQKRETAFKSMIFTLLT